MSKESVTDDGRVRFSVRRKCRASTSLSCFSFEISVATASLRNWIVNVWRQRSSIRRASDIDVENLGPPEMTDDEKHWKDPVAITIVVSLGEPSLLFFCGLYSFKRFTIDYWRSRRFRYQWHRRRLFLDVLNQNLRALSNRRHSSVYPTWPFDTWFLQLIRKKVVRCKLYEDDFESVCDVKFVTWFSEVYVLIRQYVAWICINSEDFIRIAISEVLISSESSWVRVVLGTTARALISLRATMTFSWHATGQERPGRVFGMSNEQRSYSHERVEELESVMYIDVMTSCVSSSAIQHEDIPQDSRREIRSRRVFFSMIWPSYTDTLSSSWK